MGFVIGRHRVFVDDIQSEIQSDYTWQPPLLSEERRQRLRAGSDAASRSLVQRKRRESGIFPWVGSGRRESAEERGVQVDRDSTCLPACLGRPWWRTRTHHVASTPRRAGHHTHVPLPPVQFAARW